MSGLLEQLNLDQSFFVDFFIIAALFLIMTPLYFKPFLKLFEARHKKMVEDREAATRLMAQANSKLEEYKRLLAEERLAAKKSFELALADARKQEADIIGQAREEAKKITQEAADSVNQQREELKKQLQTDVDTIAQAISERMLSRKV